jgi:hypothetical protein
MQIAIGEVRGVAQPCGTAVLADELLRAVDEVPLLPEMAHIDRQFPRTGDLAGLQNVSVE